MVSLQCTAAKIYGPVKGSLLECSLRFTFTNLLCRGFPLHMDCDTTSGDSPCTVPYGIPEAWGTDVHRQRICMQTDKACNLMTKKLLIEPCVFNRPGFHFFVRRPCVMSSTEPEAGPPRAHVPQAVQAFPPARKLSMHEHRLVIREHSSVSTGSTARCAACGHIAVRCTRRHLRGPERSRSPVSSGRSLIIERCMHVTVGG